MGKENIIKFIEALENNEALNSEFNGNLENQYMEGIVEFAKNKGFEFTVEEFVEFNGEVVELSDVD